MLLPAPLISRPPRLRTQQVASPECSTGSLAYTARWAMQISVPVVLVLSYVFFGAFARAKAAWSSTRNDIAAALAWNKSVFDAMIAAILMANSTYVSVMKLSTSIWACYENEGGESVMIAAPQVGCSGASSEYMLLVILSLCFFLLYIAGINVYTAYIAKRNPRVLHAVCLDYKDGGEWWYNVVNLYKLLAVLITTLLSINKGAQIPVMLAVAVSMATAVAIVLPHASPEEGKQGLTFELSFFWRTGDLPNNLLEFVLFAKQAVVLFVLLLVYHGLAQVQAAGVVLVVFYGLGLIVCIYQFRRKFKDMALRNIARNLVFIVKGPEGQAEYGTELDKNHAYPVAAFLREKMGLSNQRAEKFDDWLRKNHACVSPLDLMRVRISDEALVSSDGIGLGPSELEAFHDAVSGLGADVERALGDSGKVAPEEQGHVLRPVVRRPFVRRPVVPKLTLFAKKRVSPGSTSTLPPKVDANTGSSGYQHDRSAESGAAEESAILAHEEERGEEAVENKDEEDEDRESDDNEALGCAQAAGFGARSTAWLPTRRRVPTLTTGPRPRRKLRA